MKTGVKIVQFDIVKIDNVYGYYFGQILIVFSR